MARLGFGLGYGAGGGGGSSGYSYPSQFAALWTPDFTVTRENDGTYTHSYDPASDKPTGVEKYVNPTTGSNANNGNSSGTAYQTLQYAYDQGAVVINMADGWYDQTTGFNASFAPNRSLALVGPSGGIAYINRAITSPSFTLDSGNVYKLTGAGNGTATVIDLTRTVSTGQETLVDGTTGVPIPFTKVADKATCEATQYSYFDDGVDLYVHVTGSAPNTTNVKVLSRDNVTAFSTAMDDKTLYLENVEMWGKQPVKWDASAAGEQSLLVGLNAAARYAILDNWDIDDITTRLVNCYATDSREADGFNYHRNVTYSWTTTHLEADCYAARNGYQGAGNNDNNFTTHDRVYFIRLNCVGREAKGPNFADTAGSFGMNLGCFSYDSLSSPEEGFSVGASSASYEGVVWYQDCTDSGSTRGFSRSTGAHLVQLTGNTGTTNGTIVDGTDPVAVAALFGPVNTVAPVVSGTETVGQTLTCTTGTWTGLPVITYTYQWQNDGGTGTWANISGATSSTYGLQASDAGDDIRCIVTALVGPALDPDAFGSVSATSNVTGAISGSAADNTPNAFDFTDTTGTAISTLVSSNIVQVTGMDAGTSISISGSGSPQYRICTDSGCSTVPHDWTSSAGTIDPGEYVQVRLTSSALEGTSTVATLTVGTLPVTFQDTTSSPAYDSDAQTYFTAVEATGATISVANKTVINDFVLALKSNSLWTNATQFWINWGIGNVTDATTFGGTLVKLKGSGAFTNTGFDNTNYSATAGITGNGTDERLLTNYTHGNGLSNFNMGLVFKFATFENGSELYSDYAGTDTIALQFLTSTGNKVRISAIDNGATTRNVTNTTALATNTMHHVTVGIASSVMDIYYNGVVNSVASATLSTTLRNATVPLTLFSDGSADYTAVTIGAWYAYEAALTAAEIAIIDDLIDDLITGLGVS